MSFSKTQLIVVALSLAVCAGALADDEAQPDEAKAAFDEGASLFAAGDFPEAAKAFRRAYEIKPSWRLLYNIGQSEAAAKRHGLAMDAFEKYLSQGGDDVDEARRLEVAAEIERLRTIVGTVEIVAPDDSQVVIDGVERGATPLPGRLKVATGVEHQVEIRRGSQVLLSRTISVGSRENLVIEVIEDDAAAPAVAADTSAGDDREELAEDRAETAAEQPQSALETAGWVTLGVGGAMVITGGVTGLVALSRNKQLVDECNDADGCEPDDYRDVRDTRDAMATTSTVMFALGAAAATAGVIMLVLAPDGDAEEPGGDTDVAVTPAAGFGFAGIAVSGRF
jgi:tetratricopeptide (TPR) repeat protein